MFGKDPTGKTAQIAMVSLFTVFNVSMIVSPCVAYIGQAYWPDMSLADVSYIATMSGLTVAPLAFISGILAGRKVGFRPLAILGIALMVLGGVIPFFTHDFAAVIASRAVFGAGQGFCQPMGNAMIVRVFEGKKAASLQGIGNVLANVSAIALQLAATALCLVNVDYIWLLHLLMLVPWVICLLWLPEPGKEDTASQETAPSSEKPAEKEKLFLPAPVWVLTAAFSVMFIGFYPQLLNVSGIILNENLGPATIAGVISTLYTIGGVVAGPLYAVLYPRLKRGFFPVAILIWIAGMAIYAFGRSAVLLGAGCLISGIGVFLLWPGCAAYFGQILPENSVSTAVGIWSAIFAACAFLASPFMGIVAAITGSSDPRMAVYWGLGLMVIVGVLWSAYMLAQKRYGEKILPESAVSPANVEEPAVS